jgi:16S rRNA (guanine527-N7)-methyltransferase
MEELIFKYFGNLSERNKMQIKAMYGLYEEWNSRINVISRKDFGNFYLHHVLHSLAIAKFTDFPPGSSVLDVGTGGGFPGIPLAVLFPNTNFTLCDSIGKKIKVAGAVASELKLENVKVVNERAENLTDRFDYIVTRAVTELENFLPWVWTKCDKGILALKGGDLTKEISGILYKYPEIQGNIVIKDITEWFGEDFFKEKKVIFIKK